MNRPTPESLAAAYVAGPNPCNCHVETCSCPEWRVSQDGDTIVAGRRTVCEKVADALNLSRELDAQREAKPATYEDFVRLATSGERVANPAEQAQGDEPEVSGYDPTPARRTVSIRWPDGHCMDYSLAQPEARGGGVAGWQYRTCKAPNGRVLPEAERGAWIPADERHALNASEYPAWEFRPVYATPPQQRAVGTIGPVTRGYTRVILFDGDLPDGTMLYAGAPPVAEKVRELVVCNWRQQDEGGDHISTGCGQEFVLNDANDYEEGKPPFPFCCYCAKPTVFFHWTDEDSDDE